VSIDSLINLQVIDYDNTLIHNKITTNLIMRKIAKINNRFYIDIKTYTLPKICYLE